MIVTRFYEGSGTSVIPLTPHHGIAPDTRCPIRGYNEQLHCPEHPTIQLVHDYGGMWRCSTCLALHSTRDLVRYLGLSHHALK